MAKRPTEPFVPQRAQSNRIFRLSTGIGISGAGYFVSDQDFWFERKGASNVDLLAQRAAAAEQAGYPHLG
ncbi:hypothetical protein DDT54_16590 [Brenneria nigrifluens DSM 30175 = ATCC 13028]|uniref:Uncharacterized protein n=1 Tax=Brenneria nigrifluens DSM 30175 = ATCC 13028 TaxID=1121120 RepID=A0A2U1ULV2_9GAMM|nr:hypothetical protein DDT54_16590 [Brenneria nigrifluens DSM 30175 = ATCC 13028]